VGGAVAVALAERGWAIADAQEAVERARAVKLPEELRCIRASIAATEAALARMREGIRPGASEDEVWALLHAAVIAADGEYVETRLLASGPRTNPWFQEAGRRPLRSGELVAVDTDVVGRYGYYADFSRTFFCRPGRPSDEQRRLYHLAVEQVQTNVELLRPGRSYREVAEKAWPIPERYVANRYFVLAHGVGMTGEYPYICHRQDFEAAGYDGVIEEGMTLSVESYIGAEDGGEGVKLEQQVLVTAGGVEVLSTFPYEDDLL
jgi:Xaa-Pro dipeptidase